ncbi:hypothetical protein [Phaeobacter sp. CECT 5382]|uniref:hypothetical protein n=1 Tax=Phaeobacter sp. CECT 5382 TaxID=1712645 RepID=UPI00071C54FF|nr:hypothetical protein [Phaeobacter sp. CECT 5382]
MRETLHVRFYLRFHKLDYHGTGEAYSGDDRITCNTAFGRHFPTYCGSDTSDGGGDNIDRLTFKQQDNDVLTSFSNVTILVQCSSAGQMQDVDNFLFQSAISD